MRGLSFKISNPKGLPLMQIFKGANIEDYYWYVIDSQNDTWDSYMERLLFDHITYDGSSFSEVIKQEHFVIFLKLQAYFSRTEYEEILSYNAFKESKCQLLLLLHDCYYIDIYMKDQVMIKKMYQHVVNCGYQNVRYINDDNDPRTNMRVL